MPNAEIDQRTGAVMMSCWCCFPSACQEPYQCIHFVYAQGTFAGDPVCEVAVPTWQWKDTFGLGQGLDVCQWAQDQGGGDRFILTSGTDGDNPDEGYLTWTGGDIWQRDVINYPAGNNIIGRYYHDTDVSGDSDVIAAVGYACYPPEVPW